MSRAHGHEYLTFEGHSMFRKILVATRNPAEPDAAVLSAARIAGYNKASLILVHVIEPFNGVETNVARQQENSKNPGGMSAVPSNA